MRFRNSFYYFLVGFILLLTIIPISGVMGNTEVINDYSFSVPEEIVEVWINTDGSADIEYWITFKVEPGGDPIDIVDIGFPNKHYKLGSVSADVDGHPISDIRVSEVVSIGVEIHLGQYTISDTGTLHVRGNQPYMIFEDTEEEYMASTEFGNTWWDSKFTVGSTNLTTRIIFPTTVEENTYTKYHYSKPDQQYFLQNGRKVFEWNEPEASPSRQYKYGVSFPKEGVTWHSGIPLTSEEMLILIGVVGGGIIVIFILIFVYLRKRRRLMDYVPPFVSVPTAGPRTDLRREVVAIVLEKPANVTVSMIILTLIQKGLLKQLSVEEPTLQPVKGTSKKWLRKYERQVLKSIRPDFSIDESDLVKAVTSLVKYTQRRIKGYSYEKTVKYYEKLIQNSITVIRSESDPRNVPAEAWYWAILDEEFLPDLEVQITEQEYYDDYYDYYPWYYHYGYHRWHWVPRGRSFTTRITEISHPLPRGVSGGSRGGGGCACACAGCACACAGGGR
ncbi:MAG: hypothetical protein ACFFFH_06695 [Candidatus Thorarchaeota archaeon]